MSKQEPSSFVVFAAGVATAFLVFRVATRLTEQYKKRQSTKLISVRRIGERVGRPIAAAGWNDVVNVFPDGKQHRIFFPNGDEILAADRSQNYFDLLPSQQLLYVAPNGEDFNPIEVLERLDEQQTQSQNEVYAKLLDVCFEKCIPRYSESHFASKGDAGITEFAKYCVEKYVEISRATGSAFFSAPAL